MMASGGQGSCHRHQGSENCFTIKLSLANLALWKVKSLFREVNTLAKCKLKALALERWNKPGPCAFQFLTLLLFLCCIIVGVG